jgi:hypothetical protein
VGIFLGAFNDKLGWSKVKTPFPKRKPPLTPDAFAFSIPVVIHPMTANVWFDPGAFTTFLRIIARYPKHADFVIRSPSGAVDTKFVGWLNTHAWTQPVIAIAHQAGAEQNCLSKMSLLSTTQFAQALSRQKSFSDAQWLKRCDELAEQQPAMFYELLTFPRDGVPADISKSLIDYLSALQFACLTVSQSVSPPISLPEFQAAIKRTMHFFHALSTEDHAHFERMMKAWREGMVGGEPVVWAGCVETLRHPGILAHPLFKEMVVTVCGIADAYACRLQSEGRSTQ